MHVVDICCYLFLTRCRYPYIVTSRGSALVFQCTVQPATVSSQSNNVYEISLKDKWFVCVYFAANKNSLATNAYLLDTESSFMPLVAGYNGFSLYQCFCNNTLNRHSKKCDEMEKSAH